MTKIYDAPSVQLQSDTTSSVHFMGFWQRVAACILDNIWIAILLGLWMAVFSMTTVSMSTLSSQVALPAILVIALWIKFASTPGKMVFKGKIVDAATLAPVSSGRLVLRYIGYFVCIFTFGLGFLWVAWDERKQGFHDKIAGTVVVIDQH